MTRWIGRWLMFVGVLHIPFALARHHAIWADIAQAGVFDVVAGHVERGHAAWFLIAGPTLLLAGAILDALEKAQVRPPLFVGVGVLLAAVFIVVLMPRSGGWLLLPPAFAMMARAARPEPAW